MIPRDSGVVVAYVTPVAVADAGDYHLVKHMKPKFLTPLTEKQVSPRDYQKLAQQQRGNIKSVDIVPPKLGTFGFGSLRIRFKTPVLG